MSRDDLIDLITTPDVDATSRRLVTDPLTGALVDRGANTYTASASLRAWLVARDRRCTQPGCRKPARGHTTAPAVQHLVEWSARSAAPLNT